MPDSRRPLLPIASLIAALACTPVLIATLADAAGPPPAEASPPARAARMVEGDPPVADEGGATPTARRVAPGRSTQGLQRITFADGSQRVDLQGRYRVYSVLTIAADGSLQRACADDLEGALVLARAAAAPRSARATRAVFGPQQE